MPDSKPKPPRGAASPSHPIRISAKQRANRAMQLRLAGATYEQIARAPLTDEPGETRRLYKDRRRAHEAVMAELTDLTKDTAGKGNELKALELARLDAMAVGLWPGTKPTHRVNCPECGHTLWREVDKESVDRLLKIMQQRSRYLGLDAQKGAETGHDTARAVITQLIDALEHGDDDSDPDDGLDDGDDESDADGDEDP